MNRLARESSPYLLLHAENPVDWFPWGEEAFAKARAEDKPIFLSIGYSTCYWCHVMERESFSDPEIAGELNAHFVSIKLDREERPDLDEIYMTATQLLTQAGGWPNSLFLTHDLKPFFAGTYFPPSDRHGRPGFPRILQAIREAWALRRAEVTEQAEALAEAIRAHSAADQSADVTDPGLGGETQLLLSRRFDRSLGGFGRAPKFPSPSNLYFLLDRASADAAAREMLVVTLDRMARGGIHDQLGGGFHRYSVDAQWLVPHFEKMLYDNAALARLYAEAAPLAPEAGFERVARATLDFVLAELRGDEGALLSALDAETDGEEGAFYTWPREELLQALSAEDAKLHAAVYGFDGPPNFEQSRHVLFLPQPLAEQAKAQGLARVEELLARLEPGRRALLAARARRKRPLTDDKVLADWNGLAIAALARCGTLLQAPPYVEAASRAARFVLGEMRGADGGLRHVWRAGQAKVEALLDDYAFLVEGLLELHLATHDAAWLAEARRLQEQQDQRLWDDAAGGYFNAVDDPQLLVRSKAAHDGAVASANGVAALNLIGLGALTGERSYRERAEALLRAFGRSVRDYPLGHVTLVRAAARLAEVPSAPERAAAVSTSGRPAEPAPAPRKLADEASDVVTVRGRLDRAAEGPWKPFAIELVVSEGFHLNANPPLLRFMVPTEVRGAENDVRGVRYPKGDRYEGHVTIEGEVEARAGRPVVLALTYQACDEERCLLPVTRDVVIE